MSLQKFYSLTVPKMELLTINLGFLRQMLQKIRLLLQLTLIFLLQPPRLVKKVSPDHYEEVLSSENLRMESWIHRSGGL